MLFDESPWSDEEVTGVRPLTERDWLGGAITRVFEAPEIELTEGDLIPLSDDDSVRILLELDPFQSRE